MTILNMKKQNEDRSNFDWKNREHMIAGSTHLFGKKQQLYCQNWPSSYISARGISIQIKRGKWVKDFTMCGIGTSILGYSNRKIARSIYESYLNGSLTTINSNIELELSRELLDLHLYADKVRFARSGGEMASVAVRMARASTNRTKILVHGYHGWHDWYLAAALKDSKALDNFLLPNIPTNGVPQELINTVDVINNLEDMNEIKNKCNDNDLPAALIIEIARKKLTEEKVLSQIISFCRDKGIMVIFDEITSGFRNNLGGMHLSMGLEPDGVLYGKTLSSGVPFSALVGKEELMNGIDKSFISSVYWTENMGFNAALQTIRILRQINPFEQIENSGKLFSSMLKCQCESMALDVDISEIPALLTFNFKHEFSDLIQTILTAEMLKKGYLFSTRFYPTIHHSRRRIEKFFKIFSEVCKSMPDINDENKLLKFLDGNIRSANY